MTRTNRVRLVVLAGLLVGVGLIALVWERLSAEDHKTAPADTHALTGAAQLAALRDPDVPELPFADNPDPNQCGIPSQWSGDARAWLNGYYAGELIQPIVFLYESHSRLRISAQAPHGAEVKILLYQHNPVVDYYLVKVVGQEPPNEGWIPEPLLSFEPVAPLQGS